MKKELKQLFGSGYDGQLILTITAVTGELIDRVSVREGRDYNSKEELISVFTKWVKSTCGDAEIGPLTLRVADGTYFELINFNEIKRVPSKELQEFFGPDYDGTVQLYISGSQGVSYGWTGILHEGREYETLDDLADYFQNWTAEWCQDYLSDYVSDVSDYCDREELESAVDDGDLDEDEMNEILDDALAECIVDCGERYVILHTGRQIPFNGFEFEPEFAENDGSSHTW